MSRAIQPLGILSPGMIKRSRQVSLAQEATAEQPKGRPSMHRVAGYGLPDAATCIDVALRPRIFGVVLLAEPLRDVHRAGAFDAPYPHDGLH